MFQIYNYHFLLKPILWHSCKPFKIVYSGWFLAKKSKGAFTNYVCIFWHLTTYLPALVCTFYVVNKINLVFETNFSLHKKFLKLLFSTIKALPCQSTHFHGLLCQSMAFCTNLLMKLFPVLKSSTKYISCLFKLFQSVILPIPKKSNMYQYLKCTAISIWIQN